MHQEHAPAGFGRGRRDLQSSRQRWPSPSAAIAPACSEYDAAARRLVIEFNDRSRYEYTGVPESTYAGLLRAPSHGTYFDWNIAHRTKPWSELLASDADVALLQEAKPPLLDC